MRVLSFAFTLLLTICGTSVAQSSDAEITKLRELLLVPASTTIVPSESSFPAHVPMKVFLAVGPEREIQDAFTKRLNKWNSKDGLKYGVIEIVSNLADANVILARRTERPQDVSPSSYAGPQIPMRSYSYLIIRSPDKLEVLWRTVIEGYFDVTTPDRVGDVLCSEFFKRIKARSRIK